MFSFNTHGRKRAVESFLVGAASTAIYNTAGGGNALVNGSGNVVLANKQLGIFDGSGLGTGTHHDAVDTTPTIAENPVIYIAQGTEWSSNLGQWPGNTYPLWNTPYWKSADIKASNQITATRRTYQSPTSSIWVVGQADGQVDQIVALDNTEYQFRVAYRGRRQDEMYNEKATNYFIGSYTTPDYTALGTTEPRDELIQRLMWDVNRNSQAININRTRFNGNDPIVGLALDSTGSAGTDIAGLTAGDFLPVVTTNVGVRGITVTADQVASLQAAVTAAGYAGAHVLTIDLATAGTATGGVADMFAILALDEQRAYDDKVPQVKITLDLGLTLGFDFNTVYHSQDSLAFEGSGVGRILDLQYRGTHGQRKYNLDHTFDPVIEFPSPVDVDASYDTFIIQHVDFDQIDTSNFSGSPKKEIILIPTGETASTNFTTYMNSWLQSAGSLGFVTL
jgi:hypothetical protein